MSVDTVLDRGLARGRTIWPAFKYQLPRIVAVHVAERAIVFGIYSGAYLHGYSYLREISYEALAQAVAAFDQAMAELTADEQRTIIENAAKRYVHDQTMAANDAELLNKEKKVEQKTAEVDAKLEALEADRMAIDTKRTEFEVAQAKARTQIKELEARIQEQELDGKQVEAEIERQRLIAEKARLDVIEVGIRVLEFQAQVADAAYRLSMVDTKKSELEADIAGIELDTEEVAAQVADLEADTARLKAQTAKESLVASELEVAKAETTAYRAETELVKEKVTLFADRIAALNDELTSVIPKLSQAITDEKDADLEAQEARNEHTVSEYVNRKASYEAKGTASDTILAKQQSADQYEIGVIQAHSADRQTLYNARVNSQKLGYSGAEEAAKIMATADITNTLTHQVEAS